MTLAVEVRRIGSGPIGWPSGPMFTRRLDAATGIVANLAVADITAARDFYTDYLGLSVEGFNLGWVAQYRSPDGVTSVQLVTRDATAPHDSVISVHVGADVDEAYAEARRRGYEIVDRVTDEAWGVRRFFVRAPDGNVINMVSHHDEWSAIGASTPFPEAAFRVYERHPGDGAPPGSVRDACLS